MKKEPAPLARAPSPWAARGPGPGGPFMDQKLRAVHWIAGDDGARAVDFAGAIVVAARRLAGDAALRLESGSRLPARPEVRAAGDEGVGPQSALGVDHDGADRLGGQAGRVLQGREAAGKVNFPTSSRFRALLLGLTGMKEVVAWPARGATKCPPPAWVL